MKSYNKAIIAASAIFVITLLGYTLQFGDTKFSDKTDAWGQFGDYFGGVINPILSFLNLWLLISLTKDIHDSEMSFQEKIHSAEKQFQEQMFALQIRPFLEIEYNRNSSSFSIKIHNKGLGPMVIRELRYIGGGREFKSIREFLSTLNEPESEAYGVSQFSLSAGQGTLSKDSDAAIYAIFSGLHESTPRPELMKFYNVVNFCTENLKSLELFVVYEDMYGNRLPEYRELLCKDMEPLPILV